MKFLPESERSTASPQRSKPGAVLLAVGLYLTCDLPALADKIDIIPSPKVHAPNQLLLSAFTVLNYVAGIAILAALVFCGIWFFQRKDEAEAEAAEAEAAASADGTPAETAPPVATPTETVPVLAEASSSPSESAPATEETKIESEESKAESKESKPENQESKTEETAATTETTAETSS